MSVFEFFNNNWCKIETSIYLLGWLSGAFHNSQVKSQGVPEEEGRLPWSSYNTQMIDTCK